MLLGEGSLSQTTGYCHHIRKKAVTKAFSFDAMSRYLPVIQDVTRKYIMDWCSRKRIMGHHALKIMNFDLACRLLLGFHGSDIECKELADVFEVFTANIFCIPIRIKGLGFDKVRNFVTTRIAFLLISLCNHCAFIPIILSRVCKKDYPSICILVHNLIRYLSHIRLLIQQSTVFYLSFNK